jgi:hypothetical protein
MCELGGTNADLAKAFGENLDTITLWQSTSKEFAEACRTGADTAANRVERALYERAVGYTYKADAVVRHRNGVSIVQRNVHVLPDSRGWQDLAGAARGRPGAGPGKPNSPVCAPTDGDCNSSEPSAVTGQGA